MLAKAGESESAFSIADGFIIRPCRVPLGINGDTAWERHIQVHILGQNLFSLLRVAYFEDLTGIGKIRAFLLQRFL